MLLDEKQRNYNTVKFHAAENGTPANPESHTA